MTIRFSLSTKLLCVILSVAILAVSLPLSALALNDGNGIPDKGEPGNQDDNEILGSELLLFDVPEVVPLSELENHSIVGRLRDEEQSLCDIIFTNDDGSRTSFLFGTPVKYTTLDGTVRDKSFHIADLTTEPENGYVGRMEEELADNVKNEMFSSLEEAFDGRITEEDIRYATLDNDVHTLYGGTSDTGIIVGRDGCFIRMISSGETGEVSLSKSFSISDGEEKERVSYPNVFGEGSILQYNPTLHGIKEDIVLQEPTDQIVFSFLVETAGITLIVENGTIQFFDEQTNKSIGQFGEILVLDSAGNLSCGTIAVTETEKDDCHLITITVDPEFLQNAVYPVDIDPTVYLDPNGTDYICGNYTFIEDVSIYDDIDVQGYTFIEWHQIGDVMSTGYYGQAAFRFPALYDTTQPNGYSSLTSDQIGSFELHLKSTSGTSPTNILRASTYVPIWPNTFKIFSSAYFNYFNITSNDVTVNNVPVNNTFVMDLTGMARHWKNIQYGLEPGNYGTPETGVLLWNYGNTGTIWLESVEYSSNIYAVLDYDLGHSSAYLNNKDTGEFLGYFWGDLEHISGKLANIEDEIDWQIEYHGVDANTGNKIFTIQENNDLGQYLSFTILGSTYEPVLSYTPAYWVITVAPGGGYNIRANDNLSKYLGMVEDELVLSNEPNNNQRCWRIVSDSYYSSRELQSFSAMIVDLDIDDSATPSFTPTPPQAYWSSYSDFDYSIPPEAQPYISYDETTHQFTGLSSGTVTVQAIHKATGITSDLSIKVNNNAIIVIPGLLASELYVGDNNPYFVSSTPLISQSMISILSQLNSSLSEQEALLLVASFLINPAESYTLISFVNAYYDSLVCNADGTSKYNIYTKKYVYVTPTYEVSDVNHENPIFTLPPTYDSRYYSPHAGNMDSYYKLMNYLHTNTDLCRQYSIEFFSYDWRLSNLVSAQRLNAFINENGYDKVVLIAHSMGGLVASGYMSLGETQRNKVKDSFMLASPLLGTPEAINVWANLDLSSLTGMDYTAIVNVVNILLGVMTLTIDPLRQLISNYQSIYELFPTDRYISTGLTPYLSHSISNVMPVIGGYTESLCEDYLTSKTVLTNFMPFFNSTLMTAAETFHSGCYINGHHISEYKGCKFYYVSGNVVTTRLKCYEIRSIDAYEYGIVLQNTDYVGDNLVPFWSATLGTTGINVFQFTGNHMTPVESNSVFNSIVLLIG